MRLLCGDFFQLTPADLGAIAAVYDRASLIALPPGMRPHYVEKLTGILPAQVEMLLVTMEYPPGPMQGPPFSVTGEEVRALLSTADAAMAETPAARPTSASVAARTGLCLLRRGMRRRARASSSSAAGQHKLQGTRAGGRGDNHSERISGHGHAQSRISSCSAITSGRCARYIQ